MSYVTMSCHIRSCHGCHCSVWQVLLRCRMYVLMYVRMCACVLFMIFAFDYMPRLLGLHSSPILPSRIVVTIIIMICLCLCCYSTKLAFWGPYFNNSGRFSFLAFGGVSGVSGGFRKGCGGFWDGSPGFGSWWGPAGSRRIPGLVLGSWFRAIPGLGFLHFFVCRLACVCAFVFFGVVHAWLAFVLDCLRALIFPYVFCLLVFLLWCFVVYVLFDLFSRRHCCLSVCLISLFHFCLLMCLFRFWLAFGVFCLLLFVPLVCLLHLWTAVF